MTSAIRAEARKDAEALLASLWTHDLPEIPLPVDPVKIARRLGIKVIRAELEPDVAGAIVKDPDRDPVIVLSTSDSPNRTRFTAAHELGHFVRRKSDPSTFQYVDFRGTLATAGVDDDERYANEFAASLLMPAREVRRLARRLGEVELAWRFDVSREAMHYRLENLGERTN